MINEVVDIATHIEVEIVHCVVDTCHAMSDKKYWSPSASPVNDEAMCVSTQTVQRAKAECFVTPTKPAVSVSNAEAM